MSTTVTGILSDQGSIVVFATADGASLAVDHRSAAAIVDLLEGGPVEVEAETWQFL